MRSVEALKNTLEKSVARLVDTETETYIFDNGQCRARRESGPSCVAGRNQNDFINEFRLCVKRFEARLYQIWTNRMYATNILNEKQDKDLCAVSCNDTMEQIMCVMKKEQIVCRISLFVKM